MRWLTAGAAGRGIRQSPRRLGGKRAEDLLRPTDVAADVGHRQSPRRPAARRALLGLKPRETSASIAAGSTDSTFAIASVGAAMPAWRSTDQPRGKRTARRRTCT
ncbi:hypothetical protein BJL95_06180 [Methylomonas sp. LWB]|nr:hypothetical protein BJL95_06180 [Methylomonas sp. LWB]